MTLDIKTASIAILLLVLSGGYFWYTNQILELEKANVEAIAAKDKAEGVLARQNRAIERLKLSSKDKKRLAEYMESLDKDTDITIHRVEQELVKDSSETNKLKIIENLLKEFANE